MYKCYPFFGVGGGDGAGSKMLKNLTSNNTRKNGSYNNNFLFFEAYTDLSGHTYNNAEQAIHNSHGKHNRSRQTCAKFILYRSGEEAAQSKSQDQQSYVMSLPILFNRRRLVDMKHLVRLSSKIKENNSQG